MDPKVKTGNMVYRMTKEELGKCLQDTQEETRSGSDDHIPGPITWQGRW
jgi:hypothetical protein